MREKGRTMHFKIAFLSAFMGVSVLGLEPGSMGAESSADESAIFSDVVQEDLTKLDIRANFWKKVKAKTVTLMAQPMVAPRPQKTLTEQIQVKSVHNHDWIAFQLQWVDKDRNEAGKLGTFSDAVAMQFPVKDKEEPPPIFMGAKDDPVHIFHWRAQYQKDKEKGFQTMRDIYPNMSLDMYPLEFADEHVHDKVLSRISETQREVFVPGKSGGQRPDTVSSGRSPQSA